MGLGTNHPYARPDDNNRYLEIFSFYKGSQQLHQGFFIDT